MTLDDAYRWFRETPNALDDLLEMKCKHEGTKREGGGRMTDYKTLKSVSVEGLKPTITLTPVIEPCGEGCRIHHIKSDSIARDGRDTFVPLRHVSKQKRRIFELEEENAQLREQMERLVTLLRVDCDIDASWDGLRRFWNIGMTESGCLMRDRACKAEFENAKLRELCGDLFDRLIDKDEHCGECRSQCEHDAWNFGDPKCVYTKRVRELGVEAQDV